MMIISVKEQEGNKNIYSIIKEANRFNIEFKIGENVQINHNTPTAEAKKLNKKNKSKCTKCRTDDKIN